MASKKLVEKWHSTDVKIDENIAFSNLFISDRVLEGLKKCGFETPSPIQFQAIPFARCGIDLIVQAKSGTGKTCILAVVALENLQSSFNTQALILAPTREVATQICDVIQSIGSAFTNLECHSFIGGISLHEQIEKLSKCHIAVGTPGRVRQLIYEDHLQTDAIRLFVLDEADVLLEKPFCDDINWIYSQLPSGRQIIALSATYPKLIATKLREYMENPTCVRLNMSDPSLLGISQFYRLTKFHPMVEIADRPKFEFLLNILNTITFSQCMIFCKQQTRAQDLAENLKEKGFPTEFISSALEQVERLQIIHKLKEFQCRVLVSTDLTSRGIDAENVNLVVNYDMPYDAERYLHRMGRAGRYGTSGIAITMVSGVTELDRLTAFQDKYHFKVDLLPDPIPVDLWGLIFQKKFKTFVPLKEVSEVKEEITPPEKIEECNSLTNQIDENENGSMTENVKDDRNGTDISTVNYMDDFNNSDVPITTKIIIEMENDENPSENFEDSDNQILEQKGEMPQQCLNEILDNKDSSNENLVQQGQIEHSSSPFEMEKMHCEGEEEDTVEYHDDDQVKNNSDKNCSSETNDILGNNGSQYDQTTTDGDLVKNNSDKNCSSKTNDILGNNGSQYDQTTTDGDLVKNNSDKNCSSETDDFLGDNGSQNDQTTTDGGKLLSSESDMDESEDHLAEGYTESKGIFSNNTQLEDWKEYFSSGKSESICLSDETCGEILLEIFHTFNLKEANLCPTYDELVSELKAVKDVGGSSSNGATEDVGSNSFKISTDAVELEHPLVPENNLDSVQLPDKNAGISQTLRKKFPYYKPDQPFGLHNTVVDAANGFLPCKIINRLKFKQAPKQDGPKKDQTKRKGFVNYKEAQRKDFVKYQKDQTLRKGFVKHKDAKQENVKKVPRLKTTENSLFPIWQSVSPTTDVDEFPKSFDECAYFKPQRNVNEQRSRQQIINKKFPKSSDEGIYIKPQRNVNERYSRQQITNEEFPKISDEGIYINPRRHVNEPYSRQRIMNKEFPRSSDGDIHINPKRNIDVRHSRQRITLDMCSSCGCQNKVLQSKHVDNADSASHCCQYQRSKVHQETDKHCTRFSRCYDSSLPAQQTRSCVKCCKREMKERSCCCGCCCCKYSEKRNAGVCCCRFSEYSRNCEAQYHSSLMRNYRKYLEQWYYLSELSKWHY